MAEILIVEDMLVQAQLLAYHLEVLGHEHRTTSNGKEALEVLQSYQPDLIISDVEMPDMNGLELCSALKNDPVKRKIPLILLTAADSPLDVLRGIEVMADGYLTKPYDADILRATIAATISRGAFDFQPPEDEVKTEISYGGQTHSISASREQMLHLFLTAYENSTAQNNLLIEKENRLTSLNDKLSRTIEQLSASEERFRGLVQTMPDIVYKVDKDGNFTFINDAIHRLGYHQSELIGRHFRDIIFVDDVHRVSAESVLPGLQENPASQNGGAVPPKLFDERRQADRMTIGLQVRLKTKTGNPGVTVEVQKIGDQVIDVEVNSLGMYGESSGSQRQYVGTVGVIRDISDRIQAQEALQAAKEASDAANRAKSDFLSSMSHELRTPLNAIIGFSQLLDEPGNPLNKDQLDGVEHIKQGGSHLLDLINEILDLAKIESGKVSISIEKIEISKAIAPCIMMAKSLAEKNRIQVDNLIPNDTTLWVYADLTRFKQILINLLSNAIKYNKPDGFVTLDCQETDEGTVRFTVSDTGTGIPEDKKALVFQPFQRLGMEVSAVEGTGIGLCICRELVHQMHGSIGFKSEQGQGSQFWVDFPISGTLNIQPEALGEASSDDDQAQETVPSFDTEKSVLYIEDNPANTQLMMRVFTSMTGCHLTTAASAEDGLEMVKAQKPDLILMDINLPGMSGTEALEVLRSADGTRDIPVVAVTAAAMAHDQAVGLKAGFNEYITKPFSVPEMKQTIIEVLKSAEND